MTGFFSLGGSLVIVPPISRSYPLLRLQQSVNHFAQHSSTLDICCYCFLLASSHTMLKAKDEVSHLIFFLSSILNCEFNLTF